MATKQSDEVGHEALSPMQEVQWGEKRQDHMGYANDEDRISKRGLEDWEMVEKMADSSSDHGVPYWFVALFFVLLLVATGLTFPFWGVRPGYERPWFDWGIVAGAVWVISMAGVIYYMVDGRHQRARKKAKQAAEKAKSAD